MKTKSPAPRTDDMLLRVRKAADRLAAAIQDKRDVCRSCGLVMREGFFASLTAWSGLPEWRCGLRCITPSCELNWTRVLFSLEKGWWGRIKMEPPRFNWMENPE